MDYELTPESVASLVLRGKAGRRTDRWLLRHLMMGSIDVSEKGPSFLQHLPLRKDGLPLHAPLGSNVLPGTEISARDDGLDFMRTDMVPNYKSELFMHGTATMERCILADDVMFGASIYIIFVEKSAEKIILLHFWAHSRR